MFELDKEIVCGDVAISFYKCEPSGHRTVSIMQGDHSIELTGKQFDKLAAVIANELR